MEQYGALSLFQPSNFVAAIESNLDRRARGEAAHLFGSIMAFPHHKVARTVSVLGFDFVLIDALHTAITAENLVALIQTINFTSEGKTCALVRVPSAKSDLLTYALDAGAAGIVFPHIDTAEEARESVYRVRYPYGGGDRSLSPCALLGGITDIAPPGWTAETIADRNIAVICQIESTLAVDNVDAIATTPGVNGLMLGAGDLRVSLGLPSRTPPGKDEDPRFYEAVAKLTEAAKRHRMALMTVAFKVNPKRANWLRDFDLILGSADISSVVRGHTEDLARMRMTLGVANGHGAERSGSQAAASNGRANGTNEDAVAQSCT